MQQVFQQAQQQVLKLSPQMLQSISLMSLSAGELRERIFDELEKNPALELVRDPLEKRDVTVKTDRPGSSAGSMNDSDTFQAFLESRSAPPETLQEHLLSQLALLDLDGGRRDLCEKIIQNLDERGFNAEPPENLFFAVSASCPEKKTDSVLTAEQKKLLDGCLEIVRTLEPQGTACADVREALLWQAVVCAAAPPLALHILQDHFMLLEKPRTALIQKKLADSGSPFAAASSEEIETAVDFIRTLEPFPARRFFTGETTYAVPDIIIRKKTAAELDESDDDDESRFAVIVSGEQLPVLALSPLLADLTKSAQPGHAQKQAREFAREAVRDAQWFLQALSKRNRTLVKTARALVYFQKQFFEKGPRYLAPLRLKDAAEFIGVHETTVSRIANSKYVQCEWGLFEIKYFFSSAVAVTAGQQHSKESVKQELKLLIEAAAAEGKKLSDEKLSKLLAEKGISAARRTVAKYRTELHINSSFDR